MNGGYPRLYQVVIRRRAYHFCVISYLIGTFVLWFVTLDGPPAIWNLLRITTWILSLANWASATIPIMILKRTQLTASQTYAPNRYNKLFAVLSSNQFMTSYLFCSISAVLLWATYVLAALALNENPELNFFKSFPGRGAPQINERPIYLLASGLYTSFCYSFLMTYQGKWHYSPSEIPEHLTIPQRIFKSLVPRVKIIKSLIFYSSGSFLPIYLIARRYIIRAIIFSKYVQLTKFIKPHMVMLIKLDSVFTLTSSIRLICLNVLMVAMWEIVQSLWDVYSSHPLDLSQFHPEPNKCLLEGIRSSDPRIRHHAIYELAHISWSDPVRRITIFKDIRTSPRTLNLIIDECLNTIDSMKAMAIYRGQLPRPSSSSQSQTSTSNCQTTSATHSALKNDLPQLFNQPSSNSKSWKQTLLQNLLSSNEPKPQTKPVQLSTPKSALNSSPSYQIPEIFQSDRKRHSGFQKPLQASSDDQTTKNSLHSSQPVDPYKGQRRQKVVPKVWRLLLNSQLFAYSQIGVKLETWLFCPLMTSELDKCLGSRQTCSLAVEVVTNLTCASLTEDQYGVLQDQIPRILESLVDCCSALESLRSEICKEFDLPISPVDNNSINKSESATISPLQTILLQTLDEYSLSLSTRLKDGISGIMNQFKPFLSEMKLTPKVNRWLQQQQ
ncbi:hypothetical protein O181_006988 [Austropuccinia psidii MF-1]|uniref:Nucleoporin NDC1 n=1 Tax=Austropuccinia psidii MF-1 TaxID=1389203 RepID=A0A9Q3GH45_9BASI|nr:hypothetical protein [Austropuccinia psidii MF-1]